MPLLLLLLLLPLLLLLLLPFLLLTLLFGHVLCVKGVNSRQVNHTQVLYNDSMPVACGFPFSPLPAGVPPEHVLQNRNRFSMSKFWLFMRRRWLQALGPTGQGGATR